MARIPLSLFLILLLICSGGCGKAEDECYTCEKQGVVLYNVSYFLLDYHLGIGYQCFEDECRDDL